MEYTFHVSTPGGSYTLHAVVCSAVQNAAVLVETLLDQYSAEADYSSLLAFYRKV